jgi:hypothetical protein
MDFIDRNTEGHASVQHARVRIFHNVTRDEDGRPTGYTYGYRPTDKVVHVATWHVTRAPSGSMRDNDSILNEAWKVFNVGDDPEFGETYAVALEYRRRRNRSLSLGDVVQIDDMYYGLTDDKGWQPAYPRVITESWYGTTDVNGEVCEK